MKRWISAAAGCLGLLLAGARPARAAWEPEPFRRDGELTGRDLLYNEDTFLHRFSFRVHPDIEADWWRDPRGLIGTAGSTKSDEFFVDEAFQYRWDAGPYAFFEFRHRLTEDFDGTYQRTLLGLGARRGAWSLAALGDPVAHKQEIDVHLEAAWRPATGRVVRVAAVFPDWTYNRKAAAGFYEEEPLTLFGEVRWCGARGLAGGAWVNWNGDLRYALPDGTAAMDCRQLTGGARAVLPLGGPWQLRGDAETGDSDRRRTPRGDAAGAAAVDWSRTHLSAGVELWRVGRARVPCWAGVRLLELDERGYAFAVNPDDDEHRRRERLAHAGLSWSIGRRCRFWPCVYVNAVRIRDEVAYPPGLDPREASVHVKLSLPFEFRFRAGSLTLNPSLRLDEARFGGGNVQVRLPL